MNPTKTPAIIIKTYPYTETSLIVSLFTAREGKINLIAKGATRPKNKFGSDLNTLNIGEFIYTKPKHSELGILIESYTLMYPSDTLTQTNKFFAASYITDILRTFLFLPEDHYNVFKLAYQGMLQIDKADNTHTVKLALLIFEIKIFEIIGVLPSLDNCPSCENDLYSFLLIDKTSQDIKCNLCSTVTKPNALFKMTTEIIKVIKTIYENETKNIPKKLKNQNINYSHISHTVRNLLDFDLQKQLKSLTFESQI